MRAKSVIVLTILTGGFCEISHAGLVQWSTSSGGNGHFYDAVLVSAGIDWEEASAAATARGGYLAAITSAQEDAFVYDLVSDDSAFWIPVPHSRWPSVNIIYYEGPWLGGYRSADSVWHWVTSESWTYSNWASGEPTVYLHNDQLQFFGINAMSSQWCNQSHGDPANGYIVEFNVNPVPLPGSVLLGVWGVGLVGWRLRRV